MVISGFKCQTRIKAGAHSKSYPNSAELGFWKLLRKTKVSKSRYLKTENLFLKYLSLDYVMILPHLVRNLQEIGVFMLSANIIRTVQSMKPVNCPRRKKLFRSLFVHLVNMIAPLLKRNQRIIIPVSWPCSIPAGKSINCVLVYWIYLSIVQGQGLIFSVMFEKKIIRSCEDKNTLATLSYPTPNKFKLWLLVYLEWESDLSQEKE